MRENVHPSCGGPTPGGDPGSVTRCCCRLEHAGGDEHRAVVQRTPPEGTFEARSTQTMLVLESGSGRSAPCLNLPQLTPTGKHKYSHHDENQPAPQSIGTHKNTNVLFAVRRTANSKTKIPAIPRSIQSHTTDSMSATVPVISTVNQF